MCRLDWFCVIISIYIDIIFIMKCLTNKKFDWLSELFKVLSDKNRLGILCFLKDGEKCVCEIFEHLDLRQNLVSHHLKVLRETKLIDFRREGVKKKYYLNTDKLNELKGEINYFFGEKNEKN